MIIIFKGFVCTGGSAVQNPGADGSTDVVGNICEPGYYCPEGATQQESCPFGTYNPVTGLTDKSECQSCPAGSYCNAQSITDTSDNIPKCSAGFYCLDGAIRSVQGSEINVNSSIIIKKIIIIYNYLF